ncbi:MAG: radical SAM protein [Desulfobacterales bacterium]
MEAFQLGDFEITVDKKGATRFSKVSYPIRYGRFSEIKTPEHIFEFNLNGEIKYIRGLGRSWPHPAEWLKRTDADDWVYYSVGDYNGIFSLLGEYYRPCFAYSSNSIWQSNPFTNPQVQQALTAWPELQRNLRIRRMNGIPARIRDALGLICIHDAAALRKRSKRLHQLIGGQVSVLPPDTRHVDYEVIPLMIADGCLYHCDFCCIKSRQVFRPRSKENISEQIRQLQAFYGVNLSNYSAVFLGNHDSLAAGRELICMAAAEAYSAFHLDQSNMSDPTLFLFGSVDSLLKGGHSLAEALNQLPFYTYINIGFESADSQTLHRLNKPLETNKIKAAFQMMLDINRSYHHIEISANFLLGDQLPPDHYRSLIELVRGRLDRFYSKGAIYLSPLNTSRNQRDLIRKFIEIKNLSRLPTFLYLIQRL